MAPDAIVKSVPSLDIFSPESANLNSFPDAINIADTSPSSLNTSVAEPPSFTVNIKSLSEVALATVTSPLDAVIATPLETVKLAPSTSPVPVTFLKPVTSLFASTMTAFDAATVPAVMPSIVSSSVSFIAADPIVNPVAVTTP